MKRVYIAADCGGTKTALAAVGEDGTVIATVKITGGTNRKTATDEQIRSTLSSALYALRQNAGEFSVIGCTGYMMHNEALFSELTGAPATEISEGLMGLLAAGIDGDGALILSGTGSDVYFIKNGATEGIMGGYGAFLGDPGSGFAIGRAAINAAIASYEGYGEKTLLEKKLTEKYPADTFRKSVYGVYSSNQPSRLIAEFFSECEAAADEGDAAAIEIFKEAADALCAYAAAGYEKFGFDKNVPYTFSGGILIHDVRREKPLITPYIISGLAGAGINNYVAPRELPIFGAVEWIKKTYIK